MWNFCSILDGLGEWLFDCLLILGLALFMYTLNGDPYLGDDGLFLDNGSYLMCFRNLATIV